MWLVARACFTGLVLCILFALSYYALIKAVLPRGKYPRVFKSSEGPGQVRFMAKKRAREQEVPVGSSGGGVKSRQFGVGELGRNQPGGHREAKARARHGM